MVVVVVVVVVGGGGLLLRLRRYPFFSAMPYGSVDDSDGHSDELTDQNRRSPPLPTNQDSSPDITMSTDAPNGSVAASLLTVPAAGDAKSPSQASPLLAAASAETRHRSPVCTSQRAPIISPPPVALESSPPPAFRPYTVVHIACGSDVSCVIVAPRGDPDSVLAHATDDMVEAIASAPSRPLVPQLKLGGILGMSPSVQPPAAGPAFFAKPPAPGSVAVESLSSSSSSTSSSSSAASAAQQPDSNMKDVSSSSNTTSPDVKMHHAPDIRFSRALSLALPPGHPTDRAAGHDGAAGGASHDNEPDSEVVYGKWFGCRIAPLASFQYTHLSAKYVLFPP